MGGLGEPDAGVDAVLEMAGAMEGEIGICGLRGCGDCQCEGEEVFGSSVGHEPVYNSVVMSGEREDGYWEYTVGLKQGLARMDVRQALLFVRVTSGREIPLPDDEGG